MRLFFRRRIPHLRRILLVESGSRDITTRALPAFYEHMQSIDLVTCFPGEPATFDRQRGHIYYVYDYPPGPPRDGFFAELKSNHFDCVGIICSGEPIMTKWKWAIALRLPAKVFIVNENGDWFWLDWGHLNIVKVLIAERLGLRGAGAVTTIANVVALPFALIYLLCFAATVHLKRRLRAS